MKTLHASGSIKLLHPPRDLPSQGATTRIGSGVLALILLTSAALHAQTVVRGRVVTDSSGRPLAGAEILVAGDKAPVLSTGNGLFEVRGLSVGRHYLLIRHVGYRPERREISLAAADTLDLLVRLQVAAQLLDSIVVESRSPILSPGLRGMEARRLRGIGKFVTTAQLRDLDGRRTLPELLRALGVNFERQPRTGRLLPTSPRGFTEMSLRSCHMQVILDGATLDLNPLNGIDIESIPISSLGGIELYKGISETPLIFERGSEAACGVIVLWTRER